jgi:hypothetical protein
MAAAGAAHSRSSVTSTSRWIRKLEFLSINPAIPGDVNLNPLFAVLNSSLTQEGIDNRRAVRPRLRITF